MRPNLNQSFDSCLNSSSKQIDRMFICTVCNARCSSEQSLLDLAQNFSKLDLKNSC